MDFEITPREYQLYIDGQWVDSEHGSTFESRCPGDGSLVATLQRAGREDVDKAVIAARKCFRSEFSTKESAPERAGVLRQVSHLMKERVEELAELESADCGKTITETTLIDVQLAADTFAFFANLATQGYSDVVPVPGDCLDFTLREPVGVVGAITAWNFPILFTSWKLGPAFAVGCPSVYKPSEWAPCTSMEVAKLFDLCGAPAGSVNVLPGFGHDCGEQIVAHPRIAKVSFTGGTNTGKIVMKTAADTMKQTTLELGGKNPNIVFDDADIDRAVLGSMNAIWLNQGQICCGGSRLLLHERIHDEFLDKLIEKTKKITLGHPLDWESRMGPLINDTHGKRVMSFVESGKEEAELVCGGKRLEGGIYDKGFYLEPTIFAGCTNQEKVCREEIFGPVLSVLKFSDDDEAVSLANDTPYGLAAGLWTRDLSRALRIPRLIRAGSIWVNQYNMITPYTPFGGYKQSGFGRDLGRHALEGYTQIKNVYIDHSEGDLLSFYE